MSCFVCAHCFVLLLLFAKSGNSTVGPLSEWVPVAFAPHKESRSPDRTWLNYVEDAFPEMHVSLEG